MGLKKSELESSDSQTAEKVAESCSDSEDLETALAGALKGSTEWWAVRNKLVVRASRKARAVRAAAKADWASRLEKMTFRKLVPVYEGERLTGYKTPGHESHELKVLYVPAGGAIDAKKKALTFHKQGHFYFPLPAKLRD